MAIKPENQNRYPHDWDSISLEVRELAGWKCEKCGAEYRKPHPRTGNKVTLSVHHINRDPADCTRENLIALCAPCHFAEHRDDAIQAMRDKKRAAALAAGQRKLL